MKKQGLLILLLFLHAGLLLHAQASPDELYKELFKEVQLKEIFKDSKTFADAIPVYSPEKILKDYRDEKLQGEFDLKKFVGSHFCIPAETGTTFQSDTSDSIGAHIRKLWPLLTRQPDTIRGSSLIPLPYPYIVPGGRFREIYYWDSYFSMLGLQQSGKDELIANMIDNFSYLIHQYGFIPNGNRTYYLSRSQPPFYSLMVKLLAEQRGDKIWIQYLPFLEKEYRFWMNGEDSLTKKRNAYQRVVRVAPKKILNRYWDDRPFPRPESYKEDVQLSLNSRRDPQDLFRDLRAACESGWDFSSRWLKEKDQLESIHTTDIIPVDLNCLLFHQEQTLSLAYGLKKEKSKAKYYKTLAKKRKAAILKYCWSKRENFFMDYDFKVREQTSVKSLASAYPLFFKVCTLRKARRVKKVLFENFLMQGGMVTTLEETHQQWDSPNGWAPLQWIVVKGLLNCGFTKEAAIISSRWLHLNEIIFKRTGKMLEKYQVVDPDAKAGGGEYPLQDGFGWTNGVYLKLKEIMIQY